MALEVLQFGGYIDGDLTQDPAGGDYVAGQPMEITTAGVKVTSTDANYACLAKNDKSEDNVGGPQAADTVVTTPNPPLGNSIGGVFGTNKVQMTQGRRADGTLDTPFAFPPTAGGGVWAEGQEIFNNGSGKWDNQTAGGSVARGRVTKAPASATDSMQVYMYR